MTNECNIIDGVGIIPDGTEKLGTVKTYSREMYFDKRWLTFKGREDLKKVIIPNTVTHIGRYTFEDCVNLEEVIIPDSVTVIDECAFKGCKNLSHIDLPDSVERIDSYAFKGCVSLSKIVIPASLTDFVPTAFVDSGLTEIIANKGHKVFYVMPR